MGDLELLELAAKAAGIEIIRSRLDDPLNLDMLISKSARNVGQLSGSWNPLTDDGDALRLAVTIKAKITIGNAIIMVEVISRPDVGQTFTENPGAATRRAIVRAAAAIGSTSVKGGRDDAQ